MEEVTNQTKETDIDHTIRNKVSSDVLQMWPVRHRNVWEIGSPQTGKIHKSLDKPWGYVADTNLEFILDFPKHSQNKTDLKLVRLGN